MSDEQVLAVRLISIGKAMEAGDVPPYEKEPVPLSRGELDMIVKALMMLSAIRHALRQQ